MYARHQPDFSSQRADAGMVAAIGADAFMDDAPAHNLLHHRVVGALDMLELDFGLTSFLPSAVFRQQLIADTTQRLAAGGAVAVRNHNFPYRRFDLGGDFSLQFCADVIDRRSLLVFAELFADALLQGDALLH